MQHLIWRPMNSVISRIPIAFVAVLAGFMAQAQLVVTSNITAVQAVEGILLGPGVTASNITFSGNASQLGSFIGTNCYLGLDSGVVMASGSVSGALGPNNSGSSTFPGGGFNGAGDADLTMAAGNTTHDAAVLQFDFVPTGDSLAFNFIFASEEYLEYVGSINDVFGFFLSGPGITGPYSNNSKNIALVPNTTSPVSINSVNSGSNSAYYVNNGTGFNSPYNTDNQYIQYDGLTTLLTASANVQCGETYHIKLAIADAGDGILDSGVFLQAGSFQSNAVVLAAQINGGGQDSVLYEGCGNATFFVTRQGDLSLTDTVPLVTSGTATEGVDYDPIPDQLIFLPGEDTLMFTINALYDGLTEPMELIQLMATWTGDCGADTTFIHMYIADTPPITLQLSNDTMLTCTDSTWVHAQVAGGYGDLLLDWDQDIPDGDTLAWLRPPQTTTYTLTVTDDCGVFTLLDSVTIAIFVPDTFVLAVHPDTLFHCPEIPIALYADVSGGTPPYAYAWTDELPPLAEVNVATAVTNAYFVTVTDLCDEHRQDHTVITVDYDSLALVVLPDTLICFRDSITLTAFTQGGYGGYVYDWNAGGTADTLRVSPSHSTGFHLTVTDGCGISIEDLCVVNVERPIAGFAVEQGILEDNFPIAFTDQSIGAIAWSWYFGTEGMMSSDRNPEMTFLEPGTYDVQLAIVDTLGCADTLVRTIIVNPEFELYFPTAFSPDGDGLNEVFGVMGMNIIGFRLHIFDRWGQQVFASEDPHDGWDGTVKGRKAMPGIYTYIFRYLGPSGQAADRYGSLMLVR